MKDIFLFLRIRMHYKPTSKYIEQKFVMLRLNSYNIIISISRVTLFKCMVLNIIKNNLN
ncbi:unnamed protein product, partial [Brassica rapa subsp. narinosa]